MEEDAEDIIKKQFFDEFALQWYDYMRVKWVEETEEEINTEKGPVEPE
jgi:hypothetical protein